MPAQRFRIAAEFIAEFAKKAAEVLEPANTKIKKLKAKDAKVQKDWKKLQKAFARQLKVANAGKDGDVKKFQKASADSESDFTEGRAAAKSLGFKNCGSGA